MAKIILVNFIVVVIFLVVIEGISSYLLVGYTTLTNKPIAERVHTEYDEELGWVNLPNLHVDDMYGPGVFLTTNSQKFRNRNDFSLEVPPDKVRIICSGDSFTLGYGVDDDHTWCQLLTAVDERLETVNLGQGGYGVDQAYLWYERNKNELEHDVHIFAFITLDFHRMKSDMFAGYGKPYLTMQDGSLLQVNYPVPKRSYYVPWLVADMKSLRLLKSIDLFSRFYRTLVRNNDTLHTGNNKNTEIIVSEIFADLQRTNREKRSVFVLVYLPMLGDYMGEAATRPWREYVKLEAEKNAYYFIDIIEELRKTPPDGVNKLIRGHYSADGNKYVADVLYKKLSEIPEIRRRFRQLEPGDSILDSQNSGGIPND